MDRVEQALAAGWYLFPAEWNNGTWLGKVKWSNESSNDIEVIRGWQDKWPTAALCVNTGLSNLLVVDLDVKGGKDGVAVWNSMEGEKPDTFAVTTPSGGIHYYFSGTGRNTASELGEGIDTRGVGGMVPIPGMTTKGEYKIKQAVPVVDAPTWLTTTLGRPMERAEQQEPAVELDLESSIRQAETYMRTVQAPPVGERDATFYKIGCRLRDFGISQDKATEMISWYYELWGPWDDFDELLACQKMANAYTYAKLQPGAASAQALADKAGRAFGSALLSARCACDIVPADIQPRQWLLGRRILRRYVSLLLSPGGIGKSMLTTVDGVALASGIPLVSDKVHEKCTVWLHNAEDGMDEIEMRLAATAAAHGVELRHLPNLRYTSGRVTPLRVASLDEKGKTVLNHADIEAMKAFIQLNGIDVCIFDPLIKIHRVEENKNVDMDLVMSELADVAEELNVAIVLVHHTKKLVSGAVVAGNVEAGRGASAIKDAARIAHTLAPMSKEEAESFAIPEEDLWRYFRMDDAKLNLAPSTGKARWFRKVSHDLENGESVGVVTQAVLVSASAEAAFDEASKNAKGDLGRDLVELLGTRVVSLTAAAQELQVMCGYDVPERTLADRIKKTVPECGLLLDTGSLYWTEPPAGASGKWYLRAEQLKK